MPATPLRSPEAIDPLRWRLNALPLLQVMVLAMAFMAPGKLAPLNVLTVLIALVWLVSFRVDTHWRPIRRLPFFLACQVLFWITVIGLLWTEDLANGLDMVDHALPLLILAPPLLSIVPTMNREHILTAFLAGLTICSLLAHYNWLQLHVFPSWPASPLDHPDPVDTAPFTGWVAFAPLLAIGCYLAAQRALVNRGGLRALYAGLALFLLNNLIFSGGRTGMVALCALLALACFRWFGKRWLLAVLATTLLSTLVLGGAYLAGGEYRVRVERGFSELQNPDTKINGSVSSRIVMARHTWQMIRHNPWLGVGTGDWPVYYWHLNKAHTPKWQMWREPHNQYLLTTSTLGIAGLMALLWVYVPIMPVGRNRRPPADHLSYLRWAVPTWFGAISVFGSYLWDSHSSLVFVLFSAVAWSCPVCGSQKRGLQQRPQAGP